MVELLLNQEVRKTHSLQYLKRNTISKIYIHITVVNKQQKPIICGVPNVPFLYFECAIEVSLLSMRILSVYSWPESEGDSVPIEPTYVEFQNSGPGYELANVYGRRLDAPDVLT